MFSLVEIFLGPPRRKLFFRCAAHVRVSMLGKRRDKFLSKAVVQLNLSKYSRANEVVQLYTHTYAYVYTHTYMHTV